MRHCPLFAVVDHFFAVFLPHFLLLTIRSDGTGGIVGAEPQLVQTARLGNVTLIREVHFAENSSLLDNIQLLDQLYNADQQKLAEEAANGDVAGNDDAGEANDGMHNKLGRNAGRRRRVKKEQQQQQRGRMWRNVGGSSGGDAMLRARILLVGDHSLFQKFLLLYGADEYAAYNGLTMYLNGVFTQLHSIFSALTFSIVDGKFPLQLELAGPPMIVLRPEDCPLRSPLLNALIAQQQRQMSKNNNSSSSSSTTTSKANFPSSAALPTNKTNNNSSVNGTTTNWDQLDALVAVQWISKWARQSQWERLLPAHEHLLLITAMDLLSQQNDSSTQGMAYVRAMCRGADSVSVVEDVGGLGTSTVAAHEMGHSLGAFHDGGGPSENCTQRHNFLMSPMSAAHPFDSQLGDTFPNAFLFSACSRVQIEDFLNSTESECLWQMMMSNGEKGGDGQMRDGQAADSRQQNGAARKAGGKHHQQHGRHRLMKDADDVDDYDGEEEWGAEITDEKQEEEENEEDEDEEAELAAHRRNGAGKGRSGWMMANGDGGGNLAKTTTKPGEQFHPNRQCQIVFGPSYGLCQRRDFLLLTPDPCRRLWCKDRRQRRWAACETKGFLPMMDGSRCGEGKWCIQGKCRPRPGFNNNNDGDNSKHSSAQQQQRGDDDCADLNRFFCLSFDVTQLRTFCPVATFRRLCCATCASHQHH